ncbi:hypothetical protein F2Q69_00020455 [Brassica cretica]|uniref:UBC core domain-containing protein n=1 Tax=Brassica cretica TaxID=69181 RepID=A0A8S9QGC8_BRACR|nr:hypothetical protein F2Q69_00020455 [Brassica cretica]
MLGTVSDIGVNCSQTLAFGTLQGECMLSQTLILPNKSKMKTANEIFSIGISRTPSLAAFNCMELIPVLTAYEGKIFQLKLFCGKDYPQSPPTVRFLTRINMSCVNPDNGVVEPSHFPMLSNWRREYTMEDLLMQLKKEMMSTHNRKLSQPLEDSNTELNVSQSGIENRPKGTCGEMLSCEAKALILPI